MIILQDQYRLLGENVAKLRTDLMKEQLATFRSQLEDFARKHKVLSVNSKCEIEQNDIRKNPTFRSQFHEMCAKVGVDPLASNKEVQFFPVLGNGFEVISVGKKKLVHSVPTELNKDHNQILELAQAQGFVTVDEVERRLSWTSGRAIDTHDTLLDDGLAMIDDGHRDGKRQYWFPCVSSITSSVGADS
ncbi:hypothetical protein EZV62_008890 [Acer yangbiense]|uniref:Uncharacterized protein n=1 Tax=Acer yangbiense TaxID=1000413 RepID=A0A5C7IF30_9ROSI|nr:hypothetical protein EZV62_008890 [Acer yangbiense]